MKAQSTFTSIRTEGGLLPADLLVRVAALEASLPSISPTAYHLLEGERLNEAINRSWNRLVGAWAGFRDALANAPADDRGTTVTRNRWSLVLFQELGHGQLQAAKAHEVEGKAYPISHSWGQVPIHLVSARLDLGDKVKGVAGAATMTPHGLVQEFLNRSHDHLWGFVCNGLRLRLLRDNVALTRQAFVEFDLEAMFDGQQYADFAVLWLVCHQSRLEGEQPAACVLEQWSADAAKQGTRALDQLRSGVETAIAALGEGFLVHRSNAELRAALEEGVLRKDDYYRQLLRLVYRLLFLFVAEDRGLLLDPNTPADARDRYTRFYSLSRVRDLAAVRRGGPHGDLWAQLRVVFAALGRPDGAPQLGLPGLGSFLWSGEAMPHLHAAELPNRNLLRAIAALSTMSDGKVRRAIDYRRLGSEELGSVYESLLELHPELSVQTREFRLSTAAGNERKTTGSYYTPTSLITELLNSALDPVLAEAAAKPNAEDAILDLKVIDPACGSGHFLIAAAHRIAKRLAAVRTGDDEPSPEAVRHALRDVVGRCLHGIDVNPMAVELCKVSLWMEAMEPGKPLSFLDHRIVAGNGLLGATPELLAGGVPDEAFKQLTGDDKATVASLRKRNAAERKGAIELFDMLTDTTEAELEAAAEEVDRLGDDHLADVRAKEQRWSDLLASDAYRRAVQAANTWCAAFVAPKAPGEPTITHGTYRATRENPAGVPADARQVVQVMAERYGFLHWHLTFLDVYGPHGRHGFDVVLGNPPWEQLQYDPQEVFAVSHPHIANAPTMAKRNKLLAALEKEEPDAFAAHLQALRQMEGVQHFIHESGRFPYTSFGRLNTAPLFVEASRDALGAVGRVGIVVPTGIATDSFNQRFFRDLVDQRQLMSLFDFENAAPIFEGVHRSFKFCLLTLAGRERPVAEAEFAFFAHETADIYDRERRFTLSPDDFALINPNTRTAPVFRTRRDAELTKQIYHRVPVLVREGDPNGNPWGIDLEIMFMTNVDSHLFRTADDLEQEGAARQGNRWVEGERKWMPLYEAKMAHHFNHRFGDYSMKSQGEGNSLPTPSLEALQSPKYVVQPRYWVEAGDSRVPADRWLLGFRDICRSTDERTLIPFCFPATSSAAHRLAVAHRRAPLLAASMSSFVADFIARFKVGGTHVNLYIAKQLAVLSPYRLEEACHWSSCSTAEWLDPRVLELTYTAWDLRGLAADLGYDGPPFRWDPARRELLRAELDAAFFHLYGIERDDVDYIMDTFPIVRRKDEATHGEYRTKRLILERYDALAECIANGTEYQTILDPPPAHPSLAHPESTRPDWAKDD